MFLLLTLILSTAHATELATGNAHPSLSGKDDAKMFVGDPMVFFKETDRQLEKTFPTATLTMIATNMAVKPDQGCSSIGWQFIYYDQASKNEIRRTIRRQRLASGACGYAPDPELKVTKAPGPPTGMRPIEGRFDPAKINFSDAIEAAIVNVGNGFRPQDIALKTPLYPGMMNGVFWMFNGGVECKKSASVVMDSSTGKILPGDVPSCP